MARTRRERGAAAVEMAILLPVLILIIGGIVDFGRAFLYQIVLTNAAREGTRVATMKLDSTQITTRTRAAAQNLPVNPSSIAVNVSYLPVGSTGCGSTGGSDTVKVTADITNFQYFFLDGFIPGLPHTMSGKSQMGC